jgi:hypothetical protein
MDTDMGTSHSDSDGPVSPALFRRIRAPAVTVLSGSSWCCSLTHLIPAAIARDDGERTVERNEVVG